MSKARARLRLAGIATSVLLVLGPLGASPANAAAAASGPAGFAAGFATPVVVIEKGEGVTFFNGDIAPHDFVADGVFLPRRAALKTRWCSGFDKGRCPLFWSPRVSLGQTTEVEGLSRVVPGKQYPFYCSVHPGMKGTLVVR